MVIYTQLLSFSVVVISSGRLIIPFEVYTTKGFETQASALCKQIESCLTKIATDNYLGSVWKQSVVNRGG